MPTPGASRILLALSSISNPLTLLLSIVSRMENPATAPICEVCEEGTKDNLPRSKKKKMGGKPRAFFPFASCFCLLSPFFSLLPRSVYLFSESHVVHLSMDSLSLFVPTRNFECLQPPHQPTTHFTPLTKNVSRLRRRCPRRRRPSPPHVHGRR